MSAVEKDLTPFKKRGGKLLMYTGWSDPVVPPQDTVAYYDGVVKTIHAKAGATLAVDAPILEFA